MATYRVNEYGEIFPNRPSRQQRRNSSQPQDRQENLLTRYRRCIREFISRSRAAHVLFLWPIVLAVVSVLAAAGAIISFVVGLCYCLFAIIQRIRD